MKKILITILMFMLVVNVKAASDIAPYEVIVSNKDAACVYVKNDDKYTIKTDDCMSLNQKVTITSEFYYNNELFGVIGKDDDIKYVKLSDFNLVSNSYTPSGENLFSESGKAFIFNKSGSEMYSGPSRKYNKLNVNIPSGEVVSYLGTNDKKINTWSYVEYNGTKGWIYSVENENQLYKENSYVAKKSSNDKDYSLLTLKSINIYDFPNEKTGNSINKINSDSEIKVQYTYGYLGEWRYINFDNVTGWVKLDNKFAFINNDNTISKSIILINKSNAYISSNSDKVSLTIPSLTKVDYDYESIQPTGSWVRIKYDECYYWVFIIRNSFNKKDFDSLGISENSYSASAYKLLSTDYSKYTKYLNEKNIYKNMTEDSEIIGKYNNETINNLYKYSEVNNVWIYIETDNYNGWYHITDEELAEAETLVTSPIIDDPAVVNEDNNVNILAICICVFAVLAIVVLAIIIVKNKKKNSKE